MPMMRLSQTGVLRACANALSFKGPRFSMRRSFPYTVQSSELKFGLRGSVTFVFADDKGCAPKHDVKAV